MTYSVKDEEFLIKHYPIYGPKYCASVLGRDPEAIGTKARRMNLKKQGRAKHPSMQKINPEQFTNIRSPEIAYLLGYLWADGYIHYSVNKTSHRYAIVLEIVSEDAKDLSPILTKTGQWGQTARKRKDNWRETTSFTTNSKDIYEFLFINDYKSKPTAEPTKILSQIPNHLKHYWWRGYFDGDGYISFAEPGKGRWKGLGFSSTYGFEWKELINLFQSLDINNYSLTNSEHKTKKHRSSKISLQNNNNIILFSRFLLQSEIGLSRKTNKLKEFILTRTLNDS